MPGDMGLTSAHSPFQTDPENTDYTMEHGATRNFQAEKLLEEEEKRVQKEREDEELNNPMKVSRAPASAFSCLGPLGRVMAWAAERQGGPGALPPGHTPRVALGARMQASHSCGQVVRWVMVDLRKRRLSNGPDRSPEPCVWV